MKPLQLHKPHLLVTIGLPASGKTFFASQFAATFNAPFLDFLRFEQVIEDKQQAATFAFEMLGQLVKTGQTIVIDGYGNSREQRQALIKVAHGAGYEVLNVWVQTEPATIERRAVSSRTATMTAEEFVWRSKAFQQPTKTEKTLVISGKHTYASQAKNVLRRLVEQKPTAEIDIPKIRVDKPVQKRSGRIIVE